MPLLEKLKPKEAGRLLGGVRSTTGALAFALAHCRRSCHVNTSAVEATTNEAAGGGSDGPPGHVGARPAAEPKPETVSMEENARLGPL